MFKVDAEKCIGCQRCVDICSEGAISIMDSKAVIDGSRCNECAKCVSVCSTLAISPVVSLGDSEKPSVQAFENSSLKGSRGGGGMGSGAGMGRGMGRGPRDGRGGGKGGGGRR